MAEREMGETAAETPAETSKAAAPAGPNAVGQPPVSRRRRLLAFAIIVVIVAGASALVTALLVSIFNRKQEAKNPYLKLVNVDENTTDPSVWGTNWPREYDTYQRTADVTRTYYGGSEAMPEQKLERDPWLRRMFSGYAF